MIHFISDLHLSARHPETAAAFGRYIAGPARTAQALYILGDLFDAWPGDDALVDPAAQGVANAIASLASAGCEVFLMHGNRDFLIDSGFAEAARLTLIPDPHPLKLGERDYILMHGDSLCTDDIAYQSFRAMVRNPEWRRGILAKTLAERLQIAAEVRSQSEDAKQEKSAEIMDVNGEAVSAALRQAAYPDLIHGHTHRPACHELMVDGQACKRWVLHDWKDRAEWLEWTAESGLVFRSC
ncbi:UDP-2,3-diacylglucosamine diphosphatase [Niveibacterium sp. 24ML]|uniref:UDP-2,3-diacylglucosamine diphosphatase n=1 Tax=Niveibacterium sp. 24ML TaxID=2985512 RepID=UPI00226EA1F3|nr:UDP-2,3-diacylglucosamine diphosphatase [Niveibacterium sp. 24ML]MCX9155145.1 UDP-2,3-diacylglucosamine diphosphatase [Niveibacterium sp. 24ML]